MTSNGTATDLWDVVIVGAGPAGMAAALYTGRAKLKTLVLDRMGAGHRPAAFVHGLVVVMAQEGEVGEVGSPAVGPVHDVVPVA